MNVNSPSTLAEWLRWQETLHPREIDLGLERVAVVARRLGLENPQFTLITVGGTNGKGSTVAMLESIYRAAGYRVGRYTSPHLLRYNERIAINNALAGDQDLCAAFQEINQARGEISLTYFEFGTLAAMWLFARAAVDIAVLEVGLGGRLDAVNVWDADVAVVTGIDIDHTQWLGDTREQIGREKAGILRAGRPAVCGDAEAPASLLERAKALNAPLYCYRRDFGYTAQHPTWAWQGPGAARRSGLPWPNLRGTIQLQNASVVLMVLHLLQTRYPVQAKDVRDGLLSVSLAGRFHVRSGAVCVILDVAHNPQAATVLAQSLREQHISGQTFAVFGVLADKDIAGIVGALRSVVDAWFIAPLAVPRGAGVEVLAEIFNAHSIHPVPNENIRVAYLAAQAAAQTGDRILVCGSFYTVAAIMEMSERG
ncbi:MAG: bifunctional tetrahydrofolate synthase/dihydrofolate synthase [Pseudomonadota bacterium]